jgi:hypothetical protein
MEMIKKHQGTNIEEIQARSRGRKNWTSGIQNWIVQFWILKYPVFPEQVESEESLRFSLFKKDLVLSDSKSYILLHI